MMAPSASGQAAPQPYSHRFAANDLIKHFQSENRIHRRMRNQLLSASDRHCHKEKPVERPCSPAVGNDHKKRRRQEVDRPDCSSLGQATALQCPPFESRWDKFSDLFLTAVDLGKADRHASKAKLDPTDLRDA